LHGDISSAGNDVQTSAFVFHLITQQSNHDGGVKYL